MYASCPSPDKRPNPEHHPIFKCTRLSILFPTNVHSSLVLYLTFLNVRALSSDSLYIRCSTRVADLQTDASKQETCSCAVLRPAGCVALLLADRVSTVVGCSKMGNKWNGNCIEARLRLDDLTIQFYHLRESGRIWKKAQDREKVEPRHRQRMHLSAREGLLGGNM